ncbi:MAG: serine/threonine protein kinase, partial [Akkermansia sp.]|nr:serine/threonine protein kinase [Akkermansia sp.]
PFYGESVYENTMDEHKGYEKYTIYGIDASVCQSISNLLGGTGDRSDTSCRAVGGFMEGILAAAREEVVDSSISVDENDLTSILDNIGIFDDAGEDVECNIAPKELPDGTLLHGYRVKRTIGCGGFGVTYLAQESLLNRTVVIKENFPDSLCYREEGTLDVRMHDPEAGRKGFEWAFHNFLREVRLLATLDHPCIAKVYSYFEEHRTAYYVVEYINGVSLDKLALQYANQGRTIPQSSLIGIMVRLLDALDYLHARKILHRDIKPDNILVTRIGLPVIIDFGAARESYGDLSDSIVETPGFSPSEQSNPNGNMGPWTDLYAFGATMYYLLTGAFLPNCQQREIYDTVDPLAQNPELCQRYNPALLATIDRAIDPIPARRYQNVAEWMQDIAATRL